MNKAKQVTDGQWHILKALCCYEAHRKQGIFFELKDGSAVRIDFDQPNEKELTIQELTAMGIVVTDHTFSIVVSRKAQTNV